VISALRRQWRDPGYAVVRPLPARDSDLKTRIDHAALG
jgi:hypothetical protein